MSTPFPAIERLESKGESETLFRYRPKMRWRFDRRTSMPWRKVCFSKRVSLYCSCLMCFFTVAFFTPLAFFMLAPRASRMLYNLGRRPTYSAMGCPAHSSCPLPSWSPCCAAGGQTCHKDQDAWPYPCIHPPSGSQGAGCQCLCRGADSAHHIPP